MFEGMQTIEVINKGDGHGGGDSLINNDIFIGRNANDPLKRYASEIDGALAVLIGIAAKNSLKEKKIAKISDLLE